MICGWRKNLENARQPPVRRGRARNARLHGGVFLLHFYCEESRSLRGEKVVSLSSSPETNRSSKWNRKTKRRLKFLGPSANEVHSRSTRQTFSRKDMREVHARSAPSARLSHCRAAGSAQFRGSGSDLATRAPRLHDARRDDVTQTLLSKTDALYKQTKNEHPAGDLIALKRNWILSFLLSSVCPL